MESTEYRRSSVVLRLKEVELNGDLVLPNQAIGIVLFAHGSGSSRNSPRNQFVARGLQEAGIATLLMDLLTEEEEVIDEQTHHLRFDIPMLAERLMGATDWVLDRISAQDSLPVGYFGASTGAAAALIAAAQKSNDIKAVVSRGGRPDLAGPFLKKVKAPTLLIVGEMDTPVIELNKSAYAQLRVEKEIRIIPAATHLFEEPGALEQVTQHASQWFLHYFQISIEEAVGSAKSINRKSYENMQRNHDQRS